MSFKESIESFTGNFVDPDAVFRRIAGKTIQEARMELAKAAWGDGVEGIPHPMDRVVEFVSIPHTKTCELARIRVNQTLKGVGLPELDSLPTELANAMNAIYMREMLPGIDVGMTRDDLLDSVNKAVLLAEVVPLYARIEEAILTGCKRALLALGKFPENKVAALSITDLCNVPQTVYLLTGKWLDVLKLERAREVWTETTNPRLPHTADLVFSYLGDNPPWSITSEDSARAACEVIDERWGIRADPGLLYNKFYGQAVKRIRDVPITNYLPRADPYLTWRKAKEILNEFVEDQRVELVEAVREAIKRGAKEALLKSQF